MKKFMLMTIALFAVAIPLSAGKADGQRIIPRLEREAQGSFNVQPALPWVASARPSTPLSDAEHYIIEHNAKGDGH